MKKILILLFCVFLQSVFADIYDEFEKEYAQKAAKARANDPFYNYNKKVYNFNIGAYQRVIRPTVDGYRNVSPRTFRVAMYNFYDNTKAPLRIVTNLLQLKFKNTVKEFVRFVMNSVFGLGFLNVTAKYTDLASYDSNFGTVLGRYGVPAGPYIVMPVLGPYYMRDLLTSPLNWALDPFSYIYPWYASVATSAAFGLNEIEYNKETIDSILSQSIDSYDLAKDYYEHERKQLIKE